MNNNKISPGMSESQRSSEVHIPLPMTFEYLKMDLLQKTPKKQNILQNITNKKPMTVENSQKTVFYSHWRKKK